MQSLSYYSLGYRPITRLTRTPRRAVGPSSATSATTSAMSKSSSTASPPPATLQLQTKFPAGLCIDKQHHFTGDNFAAFELCLLAATAPVPVLGALLRGDIDRPAGRMKHPRHASGFC